jgi:hypothetical protein
MKTIAVSDMNPDTLRVVLYAIFLTSAFVWNHWRRTSSRITRALGVLLLSVLIVVLPGAVWHLF